MNFGEYIRIEQVPRYYENLIFKESEGIPDGPQLFLPFNSPYKMTHRSSRV